MGYYTNYTLDFEIKDKTKYTEDTIKLAITEAFKFLNETDLDAYGIKWYSHEDHVLEFSNNYPDVLFILTGIGEDHYFEGTEIIADIWIKYFFNGKTYTDKLEYKFPKVNLDRLK